MSGLPKNGPVPAPLSKPKPGLGVVAIRPITTNKGVYVFRPSFAPATTSNGFRQPPHFQRHVYPPTTSRIPTHHQSLPTFQQFRFKPQFISASALLTSRSTRYRQSSSSSLSSTTTRWIRPTNLPVTDEITSNPGPSLTPSSTSISGPMKPIVCLNNNNSGIHDKKKKYKFIQTTPSRIRKITLSPAAISKLSPRRNFSVRKYSLKRIRKSSLSSSIISPKSRRLMVITNKGQGGAPSSKFRFVNASSPKRKSSVDLSSSSFSCSQPSSQQSQSVRRATRVVQRSKKLLNQSKRKKNTFCIFFNKFGSCRRRNDGCSFIHDPRQVLICSKYLGSGSCNQTGCTLSHNEAIGKIPSCKFFNEGLCSKEKECPFRHVESIGGGSPTKKKRLSLVNSLIMTQIKSAAAEVRNTEVSKASKKVKKEKHMASTGEETSARYFEIAPNSQPILSIIPRRPRKEVMTNSDANSDTSSSSSSSSESDHEISNKSDNDDDSGSESELDSTQTKSVENVQSASVVNNAVSSSGVIVSGNSDDDHRRQRLLEKFIKFKQKSTSHSDNLPLPPPTDSAAINNNKVKMPTFFKFS